MDNIELYNQDCNVLLDEMIEKNIKADLIITDPPYLLKNTKTGNKSKFNQSFQKSQDELRKNNLVDGIDYDTILKKFIQIQPKNKINMYIWCNKAQLPYYLDFFNRKYGFDKYSFDIINWYKTNAMPTYNNKFLSDKEICLYIRKGGFCNPKDYQDASTLFTHPINTKDKNKYKHPTIKPLDIVDRLVRNSSKDGDTIFDCFVGSGTTAISAIKHNRKFIGCEINEEYFTTAKKRVYDFCKEANNIDYTKELEVA